MPRSGAQGSGHPSLALSAKLNCQGEFRRAEYGSGRQFAVMPLLPRAPACLPKTPATQQPPPHPAAWPAGFQHRTHTRFLFLLKKYVGLPLGFQRDFFPQHTLPLLALICVLCQRTVSTDTQPAALPPAEVGTRSACPRATHQHGSEPAWTWTLCGLFRKRRWHDPRPDAVTTEGVCPFCTFKIHLAR